MKMPALLTSVSIRPKRSSACSHDAVGGRGVRDVACDREQVVVVRRLDRARRRGDAVAGATERRRDARADSLRGTGDDRDLHEEACGSFG